MAATNMPIRKGTEDAMDDPQDTSEVTRLFEERLQAWKHACGYLEDYISATSKMQEAHSKEYEKVLKTVSAPLKEGDHFSQNLGGMNEVFQNLRTNTQSVANQHAETSKSLKSTVLPLFERLHSEIKSKTKELTKGAGKGVKAVEKARGETQKHIDLLSQNTAAYDSPSGLAKATPSNDPYLVHRGIYTRLNKQLSEENDSRQDLLAVQENFSRFEAHVVQVFQQGFGQLMTAMGQNLDGQKNLYTGITQKVQEVNPTFEWQGFVQRNNSLLIDPNAAPRTLSSTSFPNQDHQSTKPLVKGQLERKSGLIKKWDSSYYVVTPSKFLHEFKTSPDDDAAKEPSPELSLYLPDCTLGGQNGALFNVKGKDVSKSAIGKALGGSKEFEFKAFSDKDAGTWYEIISQCSGKLPQSTPSSPLSPSTANANSFQSTGQATTSPMQTQPASAASAQTTSTGTAGTAEYEAPASSADANASGVTPGNYQSA